MDYIRYFLIILTIGIIGYGIYSIVQYEEWREKNCEKVYFKRNSRVCIKYRRYPTRIGKITTIQRRCIEYKDTLVSDWEYRCPPKK